MAASRQFPLLLSFNSDWVVPKTFLHPKSYRWQWFRLSRCDVSLQIADLLGLITGVNGKLLRTRATKHLLGGAHP